MDDAALKFHSLRLISTWSNVFLYFYQSFLVYFCLTHRQRLLSYLVNNKFAVWLFSATRDPTSFELGHDVRLRSVW